MLPVLTTRRVRRDVRELLGGLDPRYTLEPRRKLGQLGPPGADRLVGARTGSSRPSTPSACAKVIPDARLEWIEGARTFSRRTGRRGWRS